MIYFIQSGDQGPIKIGIATDPYQRLNQLQTASAEQLALRAVMRGGQPEETQLHQRFSRLRGEWFHPTPELLVFIKEHAAPMQGVAEPMTMRPDRQPQRERTRVYALNMLYILAFYAAIYSIKQWILPAWFPAWSWWEMFAATGWVIAMIVFANMAITNH